MAEIKLKPCPFCGEKAEEVVYPSGEILGLYGIKIFCRKCKCTTPMYTKHPFEDLEYVKNIVRKAWNTRAENIVHCKDCAYFDEAHYEDNGESPCIKTCCCLLNRTIQPNDFCSYAERKELDNGEIHQS